MSKDTEKKSAGESQQDHSLAASLFALITIITGTVLALAGIDLVLPAIPHFPKIFETSVARSQYVLAAFVAGSCLGLFVFASCAKYFDRRTLFAGSLFAYAVVSLIAGLTNDINTLIAVRFFQGAASSGAAVLAPGLVRRLFSESGAIRAASAMGSIESLVPAFAPIAGAWLYTAYGWEMSFYVTAVLTLLVCIFVAVRPNIFPAGKPERDRSPKGYIKLLKNGAYVRYALGHSLVLASLLSFVFSAPAVIENTMGGDIDDFIIMQIAGISTFIIVSNLSGWLAAHLNVEKIIWTGTTVSILGGIVLTAYAAYGPNDPDDLVYMFWILNVGLAIRGGPGFMRAIMAAGEDDERASALLILGIFGITSVATAIVAQFLEYGLIASAVGALILSTPTLFLMKFLPEYKADG
jgi:MFS family permease